LAAGPPAVSSTPASAASSTAALEEAESLRVAIAFTLERGVVQDPKTGKVRLRTQPGQKRIDVSRSLWQPYIETVEDSPSQTEAAAAAE
jgi:hypothetical protein